jgi:uncharacterized protein YlxP (DUF503 family)
VFIGVGRFEIYIPASRSLKDKRGILRRVSSNIRPKFNVSIAEVEFQDLWQRAAFGVTCVAESPGQCRKVMQEVEKALGRSAIDGAEIVDRSVHVVSLDDL